MLPGTEQRDPNGHPAGAQAGERQGGWREMAQSQDRPVSSLHLECRVEATSQVAFISQPSAHGEQREVAEWEVSGPGAPAAAA